MTGLLAAEARKLWTVRTTGILTLIGLVLVVLSTSTQLFSAVVVRFSETDRLAAAIAEVGNNSIIVLVVALLVMTTEFRHGTIGRTLLVTPSRARTLLAKLGVGALYAAVFFLAALAVVAVLVAVRSVSVGAAPTLTAEIGQLVWQGLLAMGMVGVLGVAVGALVRSQVVAITGSLVWLMIVENLAAGLSPAVARWLPFQALHAVFLSREGFDAGSLLPLAPGLALVVFLGYVAAATVVAGVLMTKRDV